MRSTVAPGFERPFRPLDLSGRATRLEFGWNIGMAMLATLAAAFTIPRFLQKTFLTELAVLYVGVACLGAAYVRRLHDRNMSGWWVLPFLVAPPVLAAAPLIKVTYVLDWPNGTGMSPGDGTGIGAAFASAFAAMALFPFMALTLLVFIALPSQPGPNKYGPNPHEVTQ